MPTGADQVGGGGGASGGRDEVLDAGAGGGRRLWAAEAAPAAVAAIPEWRDDAAKVAVTVEETCGGDGDAARAAQGNGESSAPLLPGLLEVLLARRERLPPAARFPLDGCDGGAGGGGDAIMLAGACALLIVRTTASPKQGERTLKRERELRQSSKSAANVAVLSTSGSKRKRWQDARKVAAVLNRYRSTHKGNVERSETENRARGSGERRTGTRTRTGRERTGRSGAKGWVVVVLTDWNMPSEKRIDEDVVLILFSVIISGQSMRR